jgi:hypothetical protein
VRQTVLTIAAVVAALSPLAGLKLEVLQSTGAIPAHIAGRFREAAGFQQSASGQYFVFDRRAHAVFGVDQAQTSSWEVVRIGAEPGRIIDPTAFSVAPTARSSSPMPRAEPSAFRFSTPSVFQSAAFRFQGGRRLAFPLITSR